MKKIKILLLIALLGAVSNAFAGDVFVGFNAGWADFKQKSLKDFNEYLLSKSFPQSALVDDFPQNPYYQFEVTQDYGAVNLGFTAGMVTSGSRIDYTDYSGSYRRDIKIQAFNVGLSVEYDLTIANLVRIAPFIEGGYLYNTLYYDEIRDIPGDENTIKFDFYSNSVYFKSGLKVIFLINDYFEFGANAGYFLDAVSPYLYSNNPVEELTNQLNSAKAKNDWAGLRAGLCLSFNVSKLFGKEMSKEEIYK